MADSPESLPDGGPLPRPANPAEAREVLRAESFPAPAVNRVRLEAIEFTAVCPRTGQPDFGSVVIEYLPAGRCLESKALKVYLWSYREEGAYCEDLAARIADDVVYAVEPAYVEVEVRQAPRGGIAINAWAKRGSR